MSSNGRTNDDTAAKTPDRMTGMTGLHAVAKAYEQWEADLIESDEAWGPDGMAPTPRITDALWVRLIEIQAMRNAALNEPATPQWTPVAEGLEQGYYLVGWLNFENGNHPKEGGYSAKLCAFFDPRDGRVFDPQPTHYMPMPAPPAEAAQEGGAADG